MKAVEWVTTWLLATIMLVPVIRYVAVRGDPVAVGNPWSFSLLIALSFTATAFLVGIVWHSARD